MVEVQNEPMKNITINIPDQYDVYIQKLISLNLLPSRSEAIRIALKDFLTREFETLDFIDLISKNDGNLEETSSSRPIKKKLEFTRNQR